MGDQKDKFPVFPTPMAKQQMKAKKTIAEKGHNMLKKKVEVLDMRFRSIGKEIVAVKYLMGDIFHETTALLAEARFVLGDFNESILNKETYARITVFKKTENIAGTKLTCFQSHVEGTDYYSLTGLAKGGERINALKQAFMNAIETLVELATLQTTFITLDEVLKATNRRVNALEQMYLPKIKKTLDYIDSEMDENARQDFFRMKKIKVIQKKAQESAGRLDAPGEQNESTTDTTEHSSTTEEENSSRLNLYKDSNVKPASRLSLYRTSNVDASITEPQSNVIKSIEVADF